MKTLGPCFYSNSNSNPDPNFNPNSIPKNVNAEQRVSVLFYRRDGVVVRASASQSVDLGFISQFGSY